jgi:hypothetical protein
MEVKIMSYALAAPQSNHALRALDPDLPFLASEAAIDIDNVLSNGPKDSRATRALYDLLKNSIDLGNTDAPPRSLMDPATLTVLGEAVAEARRASLQSVEDLLGEAAKIAESLLNEHPTRPELEQARDFCLALSRAAVAYRKSIRDMRPSHPYRG